MQRNYSRILSLSFTSSLSFSGSVGGVSRSGSVPSCFGSRRISCVFGFLGGGAFSSGLAACFLPTMTWMMTVVKREFERERERGRRDVRDEVTSVLLTLPHLPRE